MSQRAILQARTGVIVQSLLTVVPSSQTPNSSYRYVPIGPYIAPLKGTLHSNGFLTRLLYLETTICESRDSKQMHLSASAPSSCNLRTPARTLMSSSINS